MNPLAFFKKILCLLLISSMLILACACGNNDDTNNAGSEPPSNEETPKSDDSDTSNVTLLDTDILISGEKSFRIVYSADYKTQALKIQDKLIALDKSYTAGSNKYEMVLDTKVAADETPEILVGDTNRAASAEAKALITGEGDFYAIYATKTAIAVYAGEEIGMDLAVKDLIANLKRKETAIIYNNSNGNYTKAYDATVKGDSLLEALTNTAKMKNLPVISIAVSTKDGIESSTVIPGNPCQNCYSVTKVYCVTAIGMLYDEGKIDVTDTIGEIFAEEIAAYGIDPNKWADITIHDVMRHRAGFKVGGLLDIDSQDATKWGSQDYLELTLKAELDGQKTYRYTDAAFYLISRAVTKISGEKLDVFLAKRLFNKTNCREYAFAECPQGYPIGATGLYIRSSDVAKLGRIYLDGGKYNDEQIISKEWADLVIKNGYELGRSGDGYAKGGMRGQYLYINFNKNIAVAWHSYDPDDKTSAMGDTLTSYLK